MSPKLKIIFIIICLIISILIIRYINVDKDFSNLPPTVVFTAACDPLVDDGKNYCAKIINAGGAAKWVNESGLVHGYLRARSTVMRASNSFESIANAAAFLAKKKWPY